MGFKFEIMSIIKLRKAGVVDLDGRLLEGSVTAGTSAKLVHEGQRLPIHIKGITLGSLRSGPEFLSITVGPGEIAIGLATAGDLIVSHKLIIGHG